MSTESWNRTPFSDFRQVTISALTWDRIHRRTWTSRYVQCKPSISSHPNVDSWARQNSSKSLRNSVLNSWLKSVQSLTPSYKTPTRVISTPWNPKISSFWMVSPFPRVSFLVPAVSFQEYIWDQQIHRNSVLPKWQMCEESQSGRPILISKAKGERQNSWTVEIYKKKHVPMKSRGIRRLPGGVKSLNFKQKQTSQFYQLVYEFIGQPKKSSTHNPFKDGFFPSVKHERKSHSVPPVCLSGSYQCTSIPLSDQRFQVANPNKNWENHQLTTEKIWRNMLNIWQSIWKDGKRWEIH